MLEIDLARLTSPIAHAMGLRGTGIPPLNWTLRPNNTSLPILQNADLDELFPGLPLKNPSLAQAVRALLLHWTGWMEPSQLAAQAVDPPERAYIIALAARQLGRFDAAKTFFAECIDHPIYEPLVHAALTEIKDCSDRSVSDLCKTMNRRGQWDPQLLTDLCETARAGKLSLDGEDKIRRLLFLEFNFLLHYCYKAAVSIDIAKRIERPSRERAAESQKRLEAVRKLSEKHRRVISGLPSNSRKAARAAARTKEREKKEQESRKRLAAAHANSKPSRSDEPLRVRCPHCRKVMKAPADMRGRRVMCGNCSTVFAIPGPIRSSTHASSSSPSSPAPKPHVRFGCPRCGSILSVEEHLRGQSITCEKCATLIRVPKARSLAS